MRATIRTLPKSVHHREPVRELQCSCIPSTTHLHVCAIVITITRQRNDEDHFERTRHKTLWCYFCFVTNCSNTPLSTWVQRDARFKCAEKTTETWYVLPTIFKFRDVLWKCRTTSHLAEGDTLNDRTVVFSISLNARLDSRSNHEPLIYDAPINPRIWMKRSCTIMCSRNLLPPRSLHNTW